MNKGSVLVVVAVLVTAGLLGGFYLKSKGLINLPINDKVMIDTESKVGTSDANIESPEMTLTVDVDINGNVTGKTSAYAEVFINDQETKADANGNFKLKLNDLVIGENAIVVIANDADGNVVEKNLTVNIEE